MDTLKPKKRITIPRPIPALPQTAYLVLSPLNNTFDRKCIPLPLSPDSLRIGRQTNAKTLPGRENGFFDSKVLSRQHAEVWADPSSGRVFIKDVKSSNGTFVNSRRLSNENQESEPQELKRDDTLELGIDILSEDSKTVIHHKVAARVEHAGFQPCGLANGYNISLADIDPEPSFSDFTSFSARRNSIQKSFTKGITINIILKRLNDELRASRAVTSELQWTKGVFDELEGYISQKPSIKYSNVGDGDICEDNHVHQDNPTNDTQSPNLLNKAQEQNDLQAAQISNLLQELKMEQELRVQAEKQLESFISTGKDDKEQRDLQVNELAIMSGDNDTRLSCDVERLQDLVRQAHLFAKEWQDKAIHAEAVSEQKLRELEQLQKEIELSSESSTASEDDSISINRRGKRGRRRRGYHRITHATEIKEEGFPPFASAFGVVIVGIGIFAIMNGWSRLK